MSIGSVADIHSGYNPFVRLYSIFRAIKQASEDKRIEAPDVIVVLGDLVGGHVGRDMWDYQEPHDWVKCVNFVRVRETRRLRNLSSPSQESIDELVKRQAKESSSNTERLLDDWYVPLQAELTAPVIEVAKTLPIVFSYKKPEDGHIPMLFVIGNQDIIFMDYVMGKEPEKAPWLNKKTLALIQEQVRYALAGYDPKIFFELMDEIAKKGNIITQEIINDKVKQVLLSAGKVTGSVEGRADYQRLTETIPAVAFLRRYYEAQKDPKKQCMVIPGSSINVLATHSYTPGSDWYVSYKQKRHRITPAQVAKMLPETEAKLGIEVPINVILYAHSHRYDESIETFFDPKSKSIRRVLVASPGNSGNSIESKGQYKTATGLMLYDRRPDNCTILVEGPI